jgi:hypothetical protein
VARDSTLAAVRQRRKGRALRDSHPDVGSNVHTEYAPVNQLRRRHGSGVCTASQRAKTLAAAASLASVWALAAMPLSRRLGMLLEPGGCPDACWQSLLLPALALGPLLGSLAFASLALAEDFFSRPAWRRMIAVPLLAAAGAVVTDAWSAALRESDVPSAERASPSARCTLTFCCWCTGDSSMRGSASVEEH